MKELKIFNNDEFGQIRTILDGNNEPWFVGKDVAEILEYSNTPKAIRDHVDNEDKLTERIVRSGQNREAVIINESGLYSLIFSSKMDKAKEFKRWVTSEVLPAIRKHGAYMTDGVIERTLTDPDYLIMLATNLKEERAMRMLAEAENERNKPKVLLLIQFLLLISLVWWVSLLKWLVKKPLDKARQMRRLGRINFLLGYVIMATYARVEKERINLCNSMLSKDFLRWRRVLMLIVRVLMWWLLLPRLLARGRYILLISF